NRVDSGYSGIDSIPTEIEKHVSTILGKKRYGTIPLPSPRLMFCKIITVSLGVRGVKRTRCSAYDNSGPSGVVSEKGGQRACPSCLR
ncbi:hypothetical protein PIB30_022455, partial [Stylosanthes scabra]|nr:hypothetical protein [Stylosanthes scabra]